MKLFANVLIIVAGMVGLHLGIEYSGWVVFVGCFCAVGSVL